MIYVLLSKSKQQKKVVNHRLLIMDEIKPRIIFGDGEQDEAAARCEEDTKTYSHWLLEARDFLLSRGYLERGQLTAMRMPDLSQAKTEMMRELTQNWIRPRDVLIEESPGIGEQSEMELVASLRWLTRVIYEEMYQISRLNGDTQEGVLSAGGLITHVDLNVQVAGADLLMASVETKYQGRLANSLSTLYERHQPNFMATLSQESTARLNQVFDFPKEEVDVYSAYRSIWQVLRERINDVLQSQDMQVLSQALKILLTVRSMPEFQFLFSCPFWWEV